VLRVRRLPDRDGSAAPVGVLRVRRLPDRDGSAAAVRVLDSRLRDAANNAGVTAR
jgi:hypothetical protein